MRVLIAVTIGLLTLTAAARAQNLPGGVRDIGPALTDPALAGVQADRQSRAAISPQPFLPSIPPGLDSRGRARVKGQDTPTHCTVRIVKPDPNFISNMQAVKPDPNTRYELWIIEPPDCVDDVP